MGSLIWDFHTLEACYSGFAGHQAGQSGSSVLAAAWEARIDEPCIIFRVSIPVPFPTRAKVCGVMMSW